MDESLRALLDRLYADGQEFDARHADREARRRNLEPDAAALLTLVARVGRARDIVEIGTSNGYSTVWLADAAQATGGMLTTVDVASTAAASANVREAGLATRVTFVTADGGEFLSRLADHSVDLLFLDANRPDYPGWWPHPRRVLRPGGVLAIDNVLSHPAEVASFLALLAEADATSMTVPVGKGLHLAVF